MAAPTLDEARRRLESGRWSHFNSVPADVVLEWVGLGLDAACINALVTDNFQSTAEVKAGLTYEELVAKWTVGKGRRKMICEAFGIPQPASRRRRPKIVFLC